MSQGARPVLDSQARYRVVKRVTLVGALVNLVLAAGKLVIGWLGHSQALIADGVHSLSDLLTDAVVLIAAKHASHPADEEHPYGHRRVETVATTALGLFLVMVAVGIGADAAIHLLEPQSLERPETLVLYMAALSVLAKEGLYRYTLISANRLRSAMLRANAWHHRSDAVSSVVVIIGAGGALLGYPWFDTVAALVVSVMIAKEGGEIAWHSLRELIDTGLEPEALARVRDTILEVDGVRALHMLRTRTHGGRALVDVHIQVDPRLSVSEGHQIGEMVRRRLMEAVEDVDDVMVHVDPEDDEECSPCHHLPLRNKVLRHVAERWRAEGIPVDQITLHYLDGKIYLDVFVPLSRVTDLDEAQDLAQRLVEEGRDEHIGGIHVHYTAL